MTLFDPLGAIFGPILGPFFDPFWAILAQIRPFEPYVRERADLEGSQIWVKNDPFWVILDPILTHFGSYFDPFLGHFWTYFRPILTGFGPKRGSKMGPLFGSYLTPWDPSQGPYIRVLSTNSPIMALGGPPRGVILGHIWDPPFQGVPYFGCI